MQIEFTLLRPGLRVPGDDNVAPLLRHQHPSVSDRQARPFCMIRRSASAGPGVPAW
jgi:hypothetical protein